MLARALYDNKAECSDELAFRKGDILTVLEQNVLGSEGWWRCYLHGRQGLAPANRLQLFTIPQQESPTTRPNYVTLARRSGQQSQQNIYQVPSVPKTEAGSMYEKMDNLYITPPSPGSDVYQTPMSSPAQVYYEKANSSSNQQMLTLPRASRAPSAPLAEVYDVPPAKLNAPAAPQGGRTPSPVSARSPCPLVIEQSQQLIYDIPSSPESPARSYTKTSKASNVYDVPPTGTLTQKARSNTPPVIGQFSTLPNPRKSDWIYDVPLSPERNDPKLNCRKVSIDQSMVYDVPPTRYGPVHSKMEASETPGQVYDIPPMQKSFSGAGRCLYDIPSSRDISPSCHNGNALKSSSTFRKVKLQQRDSKENVYDIPRGLGIGSPLKNETSSSSYSERIYDIPPPIPTNEKPSSHKSQCNRFSASSSDSRTSTLSTSSTSSESAADDSMGDAILEPEVAIKRISELQERLSSSIASLMIFVSSKWRLQENMEANLGDIHRAVDGIVSSLRCFIDFARTIKANAAHLTDTNIQHRITGQLETLSDSHQTLSKNQEAINQCNWSLQALVIDKPRVAPDDLDQFVMVARTIPDDVKRFVSIIIANGKLLFRKLPGGNPAQKPKTFRKPQVPPRQDTKVPQECPGEDKLKEKRFQLPRQKAVEDSGYVYLQKREDFEKMQKQASMLQLERKTSPEEKRRGWLKPESRILTGDELDGKNYMKHCWIMLTPPSPVTKPESAQRAAVKKLALSEHCYLYFGALHKATQVFSDSLDRNEPPEVFIGQGKLIIMVGQKLVDMLCQDAKAGEARNDVLHRSSQLCSQLKNLAMATKAAAVQYPDPGALRELRHRTSELSGYAQVFRSMLE
ncbi:cas scaffolding protein family member 4 [Gastrophryne carolinensis]